MTMAVALGEAAAGTAIGGSKGVGAGARAAAEVAPEVEVEVDAEVEVEADAEVEVIVLMMLNIQSPWSIMVGSSANLMTSSSTGSDT
jgi:hypothetical protein